MLISLKLVLDLDGSKDNLNSLTFQVMRLNLEIFLLLQGLMDLIKLFNMEPALIQATLLLSLKLMELLMLFKVKMDGTGQSMESKGMTGKHGKNGP